MKKYADYIIDGIKRGFTFDGCTASPDFTFRSCCDRHDYDYQDVTKTRFVADNDLRKCIARKGRHGPFIKWLKYQALSLIYWTAVRIGGASHWKKKQQETVDAILNAANSDRFFDIKR